MNDELAKRFPATKRTWGEKKKMISVLFHDPQIVDAAEAIAAENSEALGRSVSRSLVIEDKLANDPEIRAKIEQLNNWEEQRERREGTGSDG